MMETKELDLARLEKNKYLRAWRKKNRDKVKIIDKRYWEKKAQQQSEVSQ